MIQAAVTFLLVLMALGADVARGDVLPGDVIDTAGAERIQDLTSPGIQWCVRNGMKMKIGEYRQIRWPEAYREATEKYSSQVRLSSDRLTLENYVAGLPFADLDPNDPDVAFKIMWNYDYGWWVTDDLDQRNYGVATGRITGADGALELERFFFFRHHRRLNYDGRLYHEPRPTWPNPDGRRLAVLDGPAVEPFDWKGVGALTYRFLDPKHQDDTWLYLPTIRRVRRLSTSQRSDSLFGTDVDVDSIWGFDGRVVLWDWKFLGERDLLAVYHAADSLWPGVYSRMAPDEVWEKRKVYVVEGTTQLSQYGYGKRILFIDKETWTVAYTDLYDRAGELWKVYINFWRYAKEPFPGGPVYPEERGYQPANTLIDIQLLHASPFAVPLARTPAGEEGLYLNMGEGSGTKESLFTMASLIAQGR